MKNGASDAQIPELVVKAMTATYEYSLEQLRKLPHAEEILHDVLHPSSVGEGSDSMLSSGEAGPSDHSMPGGHYHAGAATPDQHTAATQDFQQENGDAGARAHEGLAEQHCVPTRPPPVPSGANIPKSLSRCGSIIQSPNSITMPGSLATSALAAAAANAAATTPGGQLMMNQNSHVHQHILAQHQHQHQQHYMLQQLPNAIPLAGKKAAGGGKGQGGRPPGVKPLSKQAKQQVAQLHAHVHAAQQQHQHRMMMGHFPAGYMGYTAMAAHGGGVVYLYISIYIYIYR